MILLEQQRKINLKHRFKALSRRLSPKIAINVVLKLSKWVTISFVACLVDIILADNTIHASNFNRPYLYESTNSANI